MNRLANKGERETPAVHAPVQVQDQLFDLAKELARKEDQARMDARAAQHAVTFNQAATIERLRFQIALLTEELDKLRKDAARKPLTDAWGKP